MQKVAYEMRISDWSSDVCSSDLLADLETGRDVERVLRLPIFFGIGGADIADQVADRGPGRVIAGETARRGDAGQVGQADEDRGIFGLADILLDRDRLEPRGGIEEIGRASCRERVCQYVSIAGVAVQLKKTIKRMSMQYTTRLNNQ